MERIDLNDAALFLDFDGTLVGFEDSPGLVFMPAATCRLMDRLAAAMAGAVAIVSGREVADLRKRSGGCAVWLAGAHGAEVAEPDGPAANLYAGGDRLSGVRRSMGAFAESHGLLLEQKATGVALHFRQKPEMEAEARSFAAGVGDANPGVRVIQGNMVSELTLAAINKGKAIEALLERAPFAGRVPLAAGDDTTDEDSFAAVRQAGGYGIKVGQGETQARFRLPHIAALTGWLEASLDDGYFSFEGMEECS